MSSLQLFSFNNQNVRTVVVNGEPWFVTADVCEYFGVTNRNRVMQSVDDEDKGGTQINTPGGKQTLTTVNESGLYSILFALQPTKARGLSQSVIDERVELIRNFKRWVTREVLPSIRKTGSYGVPASQQESDDLVLARGYSIAVSRLSEANAAIAAKDEVIGELAPKAAYADTITAKGQVHSVQRASNLLEDEGFRFTGRNTLFQWMRDHRWVEKNSRSPLQSAISADYLKRKYYEDGYEPTTLVTAKGLAKIHQLMLAEREAERRAGFRELAPVMDYAVTTSKRSRHRQTLPAA